MKGMNFNAGDEFDQRLLVIQMLCFFVPEDRFTYFLSKETHCLWSDEDPAVIEVVIESCPFACRME